MSNPMFGGPVATIREDKFVKVNPGSKVEFWSRENPEPREASVIQVFKEYGSTSIPALILDAGGGTPELITENGTWHVRVILDAGKIGGKNAPENSVVVVKKPVHCVAVQFTGGAGNAAEIVKWVAGKHAVQYRQDDELTGTPEAIILSTLEGEVECVPGSYVVHNDEDGFYVVSEATLRKTYEVKK